MLVFITIVLVILSIIGIILENNCITNGSGYALTIISVAMLVLLLIIWPINYIVEKSNIQSYYAIKQTIEEQRSAKTSKMERVALAQNIMEINAWLAKAQYWNTTIFNQAIPDEVMELKPIK